jgi:hypothetical protein
MVSERVIVAPGIEYNRGNSERRKRKDNAESQRTLRSAEEEGKRRN